MKPRWLAIAVALVVSIIPARGQVAWDSSNVGSGALLADISMPSTSRAFAVGDSGTIVTTINGGLTWEHQTSGTTLGFVTVAFTDSLHGCAAGANLMRYTTNGGSTWLMPVPTPSLGTKSIAFGSWNIGAAVGTGGQIMRTTNGGINWTTVASPVTQSLYGVAFSDSANVIAVGNNRIVRSTNGGQSWALSWIPNGFLWDATAAPGQVVVAVGYKSGPMGVAYRTTDNGVTWDSTIVVTGAELEAVSFCSRDTGYVLSSLGGVYVTKNGGLTWDSVAAVPAGAGGTSIAVSSPRIGLVSGARGNVYFPRSGFLSVADVQSLPERLALLQNYPNPFNPVTTIQYALGARAHIRLSVFNAIGQEVAVLENGWRHAGSHSIVFDAKSLPSGVYFYRLSTGSASETKRLVLIR